MKRNGSSSKSNFSKEKLQAKLLNGLNSFLKTDFGDPQFRLMSITKVELGKDNGVAHIYWDSFDAKVKGSLKYKIPKLTGKFRTQIAKILDMRTTPEVRLYMDESYELGKKIDDLLKSDSSI